MKLIKIYLIFFLTMISGLCIAQKINEKIDHITFQFVHTRRIPYQNVKVELIKRMNETVVKVVSKPMNNDKKWKNTKIDTSFTINEKRFIDLANKVIQLKDIDLSKAFSSGFDGTVCSIQFGTFGSTVTYRFWTPDNDTKERGLTFFIELCKELIMIGHLNPDEIL